ncbi:protein lifeguard 3-like isoform X2 [Liolophura sinensis]|uniref:protein lifeguard 3-like isoform X2 n=1 Tax=Liolophura sinensis TaxID=3198878 RepID=UPI00315861F6
MSSPPPSYNQATGPGYPYGGGQTAFNNPSPNAPYPSQGYGYGAPSQPGLAGAPQPAGYAPPPVAGFGPSPGGPPQPMFMPRIPPQGLNKPDDNDSQTEWNSEMGNMRSFSDKAIRHAFIRKVYLILLVQLSVTVGFVCLFLFQGSVKYWVQRNGWFYYVSYATFLVTYITLVCCPGVRRKYPGNFICLAVFTLAFSYMTGTIASFHDTMIVLYAAGITTAVCLSITLFAIQTKIDFTLCSGLIFALSMVLFFFGIACIIVYGVVGPDTARILQCVYGGLAALVFSLFLVYDTQMLVGGRKHELSPEEYIYGALQLYLDVVYLFLIILSLFGKSD